MPQGPFAYPAAAEQDGAAEETPHQWPVCPWPGWAQLYAQMIRDLVELDRNLVVGPVAPGALQFFGSVIGAASDHVVDRMREAEKRALVSCVVCGATVSAWAWPPLCDSHGGG